MISIKQKALEVIEAIMNNADGRKLTKKEMDDIYKFAHLGVGKCLTHIDWENELDEVYALFKKNKML